MEVEQHAQVPDGWEVVSKTATPPPATSGTWEDRGIAGQVWHPANGASERNRPDATLLGLPPELAVASGLGLARAVIGAGPTVGGKVIAGAKNVVSQAAPIVKYEATKTLLEKMGVPSPLAVAAAMAVSGYQRGGHAPTGKAAPTSAAAPAEAELAVTARPTPGPLPTAPAIPAPLDLGKILKTLMTEGGLNLEEANQALKWRKAGVSLETIQDRIQAARQLAGKPAFVKLPSSADVAKAVADRNVKGRWPEE